MLQTVETGRTPLQENLDRVGHALARASFVLVGITVLSIIVPARRASRVEPSQVLRLD